MTLWGDDLNELVTEIRRDVKEVLQQISAMSQKIQDIEISNREWHKRRDQECAKIEKRLDDTDQDISELRVCLNKVKQRVNVDRSFLSGIWQAVVAVAAFVAAVSAIVIGLVKK